MRHVPVAEFKDKVSAFIAAAQAGEEIVITRHGRDTVRLVPVRDDDVESRRRVFARLAEQHAAMWAEGRTVTSAEIREWINEGRR